MSANWIQSLVAKYKSTKWFARSVDIVVILLLFCLIAFVHARFFSSPWRIISVWG
jgi:hypothetical protein